MIEVLSKPADQVGVGDIDSLIESKVPESEQIEFKASLSTPGDSTDPWMSGENRIGEPAKKKILKEVTAFANAYGGVLLLGIEESDTQPPVAAKISPIPRCAELAERLKLVFRDRVEPQLPRIEIFAVQTEGDPVQTKGDKEGVVLIRVGKSRLAPHRVTKTRVCPVRRADRCEEMTMREIQDMTLNVSRGLERLERRLSERAKRFHQEFKRLDTPENAYGVRLTAAPIGDEIRIDRVSRQGKIAEEFHEPWRKVLYQQGECEHTIDDSNIAPPTYWRPMLRAVRAELFPNPDDRLHSHNSYLEIHCDGLVELGFVCRHLISNVKDWLFSPDWLFSFFANLIVQVNYIRGQALSPTAEYALDVEIRTTGSPVLVLGERASQPGSGAPRIYADLHPPERFALGTLLPGSIKFPQYSLGDPDEVLKLLTLFRKDFLNSLGKDIDTRKVVLTVQDWPS